MKIFASLYLDEDMNNMVATLLRSRGIDAVTVQKSEMLGKSDHEQLAYAVANDRCILTHNRVDYEDFMFKQTDKLWLHSGRGRILLASSSLLPVLKAEVFNSFKLSSVMGD